MKDKIAVSLSPELLEMIDKTIDGNSVRSRSQAVEILVRKGLASSGIDTAVLMYSRDHDNVALEPFGASTLLGEQISLLQKNGITRIIVLSAGKLTTQLATTVRTSEKFNGDALRHISQMIHSPCLVMSGDVFNDFDMRAMAENHMKSGKQASIGLMSSAHPGKFGTAILEGDLVTAFAEKPRNPSSNIVNAGCYIFNPEILHSMKGSIERDVLPALAKRRELVGYFTMGKYAHFGERH